MGEVSDIIKRVKRIELSARKPAEGLISGSYHSIFKGQGIDFTEIREYKPGDDIRVIDWKVTARHNQPFVREFVEERDLTVYLLVDVSGSGGFGDKVSKKRKMAEVAATIMLAALRNNDNAGLLLFTDRVERFIPARKGRKHVLRLIRELVGFSPHSRRTDIGNAIAQTSRIVKRRSVIFLISDFASPDFIKDLEIMRQRHDVIVIGVHDGHEMKMPNVGLIMLEDPESGEQLLVDTSDPEIARRYEHAVTTRRGDLDATFKKRGIDIARISTDQEGAPILRRLFSERKRRIVR